MLANTSLPSESSLDFKYYTKADVTDSDKLSSLLRYVIN